MAETQLSANDATSATILVALELTKLVSAGMSLGVDVSQRTKRLTETYRTMFEVVEGAARSSASAPAPSPSVTHPRDAMSSN